MSATGTRRGRRACGTSAGSCARSLPKPRTSGAATPSPSLDCKEAPSVSNRARLDRSYESSCGRARLAVRVDRTRVASGGALDLEVLRLARQRVVQVSAQILAECFALGIVSAVLPLLRIVVAVVELAFGALVLDTAARPDSAVEHARRGEELFEPIRFTGGRLLVRSAQPSVAVDRAQVHAVAGEL